jgi:hypothetical protein
VTVVELILVMVGCGTLGYEIVYADLAYQIKRILFLHQEYPIVQLMASPKAYWKILKYATIPLIPLIILVVVLAILHRYLFHMLQCSFCTAWQISFWTSLMIYDQTIILSVLTASTTLLITSLYNLIRHHSV